MTLFDHLKSLFVCLVVIYFFIAAVDINKTREMKKKALYMQIELLELQLKEMR